MLDRWFKKEKPLQGLTGMGGGVVSRVLGGGGITVTGGTIVQPGNGNTYHFFLYADSGTDFVSGVDLNVSYLIVAGGGAGESSVNDAGGGGAGGFREFTGVTLPAGTYPVTVGRGGQGEGSNGGNSSFNSQSSTGGGSSVSKTGSPGGSGSGSKSGSSFGSGNAGGYSPPEGNSGGTGSGNAGGGGGGAGGSGSPAPGDNTGGAGGIGRIAFSGDTGIPPSYGTPGPSAGRWFAGGGGGEGPDGGGSTGATGGGGYGGSTAGVQNTGGGGGGNTPDGSKGMDGIVIIKYTSV